VPFGGEFATASLEGLEASQELRELASGGGCPTMQIDSPYRDDRS
jgi:hypothetical protein